MCGIDDDPSMRDTGMSGARCACMRCGLLEERDRCYTGCTGCAQSETRYRGFESVAEIMRREEQLSRAFAMARVLANRSIAVEARRGARIMRTVSYGAYAINAKRSATAIGQYVRDVHAFTPEPTLRTLGRIGVR